MKKIKSNFLVVSDYNWLPENIEESWVHEYSDNYLIYDKAHRLKESDKVVHQKNVGQNIYDMFDFIITHYDDLPDVTLFCRACIMFPIGRQPPLSNGNCNEEKFNRLMNNTTFTELQDAGTRPHRSNASKMGEDESYWEINNNWYFNHLSWKYWRDLHAFMRDVYINPEIPQYIRFAPGGNYIIPKDKILRYSKNFYEQIRAFLEWDVVVGEAHMVERALYTIFTCDWEVNDKYK